MWQEWGSRAGAAEVRAVGAEVRYQEFLFRVAGSTTVTPDQGSPPLLHIRITWKAFRKGQVWPTPQGRDALGVFKKLYAAWGENHCPGPVSLLFRWAWDVH